MADLYCPTHTQTKLLYALKGGAGYCSQCGLYVQAAGVPEPAREAARSRAKKKARKKGKAKAR
jgi:hypothetical protein